jgi:CBS domain containing-hemolysin-like protein
MTTFPSPPFPADLLSINTLASIDLAPNHPAAGAIFLVLLVLLNALFVAAEFALVKVHVSQLEDAVDEKRRGARLALGVAKNIDTYLSVCQLGITASSILLGALGVPFLSKWLAPLFAALSISEGAMHAILFTIALVILTAAHIIIGEKIPRAFGIRKSVGTTIWCARPLQAFHFVVAGPVWVINFISNTLLRRVFGMEPVNNSHISHTADELRLLVEETGRAHEVTETEQEILINALSLSELTVRDILTPRNDVVALDVHHTFKENLEVALESKHTRFPLVDRHLDKTLGLIHIKDLLREMQKDSPNLFSVKRDLVGVSENLPLDQLLQLFLARRAHMALVVDEFGGSIGLVMLDDVLDQVVGEILDEFDVEETGFEQISKDEFIVEGWLPLHELANHVEDLDLEDPAVSTVGGYVTSRLGHIPEAGENLVIEEFLAEVLKADDRIVHEIRFTRLPDEKHEENGKKLFEKVTDPDSPDSPDSLD